MKVQITKTKTKTMRRFLDLSTHRYTAGMGKEVIRREKVKKYVHVAVENKLVATNFVSTNLPMAAMFLKNRMLAWASMFFALQNYLNQPVIRSPSDESQPAGFKILFALIAVVISYLDLIFPAITPPKIAEKIIESTTN